MRQSLLKLFLSCLFWTAASCLVLRAQLQPALQPEQDCPNAIPVCQNIYVQPFSYQGEGLDPNEINFRLSCLGLGEHNDVWYVFTIQQAGNLAFSITPANAMDDYDWALYDMTNNDCVDIRSIGSLEVACNYSATLGVTGANGLGPCGTNPNCPVIPVAAGRTFVLNISNWNIPLSGYTLDFGASTAVLFDSIAPAVDTFTAVCGDSLIDVYFTEPIQCISVDPTDFTVNGPGGPYAVTAVTGGNCSSVGGFENRYRLHTSPPITQSGWYQVALIDTVIDNCGNIGLLRADSALVSLPVLSLAASVDTLCPGQGSLLMATTGGGVSSFDFYWSTGATVEDSLRVFPGITTTFFLTIVDSLSQCQANGQAEVFAWPAPQPDFSLDSSLCGAEEDSIFYLGNVSSAGLFSWDFDGGIVSSGSGAGPFSVSWSSTGTYKVCLTVEENGCISQDSCQLVNVHIPPTASIVPQADQCFEGNLFSFSSQTSGTISQYQWDLGDNTTSTLPSPSHSYLQGGSQNIQLIVLDSNACSDTAYTSFQVFPPLQAGFMTDTSCLGTPSRLVDTTFRSGVDPLTNRLWLLGGGNTLLDSVVNHSPGTIGFHPVTLVVQTTFGCFDSITQEVLILPSPTANFGFENACEKNEIAFFTDSSSFTDPPMSWSWDLGDGTRTSQRSPAHIYQQPGSYQVKMVLTNRQGCSDSLEKSIQIWPLPKALFQAGPACEEDSVPFTNQSSIGAPSSLSRFEWTFGDGNTSLENNPSHLFQQEGDYYSRLIAISDQGCRDSFTLSVRIHPRPTADFEVEDGCEGSSLRFTDQSSLDGGTIGGSIQSWLYNFGGGNNSPDRSPVFSFETPGTKSVLLTVTTGRGCRDSISKNLEVYPKAVIAALYSDTVCRGELATLRVESGSPGDQVQWFDTERSQNPIHQGFSYGLSNLHFAKSLYVEAISNQGCKSDREVINALVFGDFDGRIAVSDSVVEMPASGIRFKVASNQTVALYDWDFGDGNQSQESEPVHLFSRQGIYQITVNLIDGNGCPASLDRLVEVTKLVKIFPPSAFTPNSDGHNDLWYIPSTGLLQLSTRIFDRWGKLLFSSENPDFQWNGKTSDGRDAPEGVYSFHLKAVDAEGQAFEMSGTVTLIR